jgi:hypothetical protein
MLNTNHAAFWSSSPSTEENHYNHSGAENCTLKYIALTGHKNEVRKPRKVFIIYFQSPVI